MALNTFAKIAGRLHWAVNGGVTRIGELKQIMRECRSAIEETGTARDHALSNALNMLATISAGASFNTRDFFDRVVELESVLAPDLKPGEALRKFGDRAAGTRGKE